MNSVPNMMRAIVFEEKGKFPVLKHIEIPKPENGQVLVKIDSSPINPSDILFLQGHYSSDKPYPNIPGFEGSGTVVINGGGLLGWKLVGKRVAIATQTKYGCYGEYCIAEATTCFEVEQDVTLQQAACTFVNPLSVIAMLDVVKNAKSPAVVNTAAASALGKMMVRYFQNNGVRVINVVRRKEQFDILRKEGADLILDQNDPEFLQKLKSMCLTLQATVFFDAIGGDLTGKILENMPDGTKCYVYGVLSLQNVGNISIADLIFKKKSIQGFWLSDYLKERNILSQAVFVRKLKGMIQKDLKTTIVKEFTLDQFKEAIEFYQANQSAGKVIIRPWQKQEQTQILKEEKSDVSIIEGENGELIFEQKSESQEQKQE